MPGGFWNEEKDEIAKTLFARGATAREVAGALHTTKGSVIGRAHRRGYRSLLRAHGLGGGYRKSPSLIVRKGDHEPIYDPKRDGTLSYADLTAELMGDPPIGRREIMQKLEAR